MNENDLRKRLMDNVQSCSKESAIETLGGLNAHLLKMCQKSLTPDEETLFMGAHQRGFILGAEWFAKCMMEVRSGAFERPT